MSDLSKTHDRVIAAASAMVRNLRQTADRLQSAADSGDWSTLAEIQLSSTMWTLDAIRGAAWAILQFENDGESP